MSGLSEQPDASTKVALGRAMDWSEVSPLILSTRSSFCTVHNFIFRMSGLHQGTRRSGACIWRRGESSVFPMTTGVGELGVEHG